METRSSGRLQYGQQTAFILALFVFLGIASLVAAVISYLAQMYNLVIQSPIHEVVPPRAVPVIFISMALSFFFTAVLLHMYSSW